MVICPSPGVPSSAYVCLCMCFKCVYTRVRAPTRMYFGMHVSLSLSPLHTLSVRDKTAKKGEAKGGRAEEEVLKGGKGEGRGRGTETNVRRAQEP